MRENFLIMQNYYELINALPLKEQGQMYIALINYGFEEIEPDYNKFSTMGKAVFNNLKIAIKNQNQRYDNCVKNGKKGGAPKGNQNARKNQPKNNQIGCFENQAKNNQENNQNKNKNKNKNNIMVGNYNNLEGNNKKNINKSVCACDREPYIEFLKDYFYFCSIKLSGEQFNKGCEIIDKIISFRNDAILGNLKFKGHTYTEYEFLDKLKHLTFERFSNIMGNIRYGDNIENEEGYLLGCILHYPQKEVNENFGKLIKELEVDYEFGTD